MECIARLHHNKPHRLNILTRETLNVRRIRLEPHFVDTTDEENRLKDFILFLWHISERLIQVL